MNINVIGEYMVEIPSENIIIKGHNLITLFGESFFLTRLIDNYLDPLQYILLGKGTDRPTKNDTKLGKETFRTKCTTKIDPKSKQLILQATIQAKDIVNTTEIGTSNGKILISRDLFNQVINDDLLDDLTSEVHITYIFNLTTGGIRSNWAFSTKYKNNIYYTYEPAKVKGVFESNTGSGYVKLNTIEELQEHTGGAYYYDDKYKYIYIKTSNTSNPTDNEIIIEY